MTVSLEYLIKTLQYLKDECEVTQILLNIPFDYVIETDKGNWYARVVAKEANNEERTKATD